MSSGTSTKGRHGRRDAGRQVQHPQPPTAIVPGTDGIQPWHFFTVAGLASATGAVFMARESNMTTILLLSAMVATGALIGMAVYRTLVPLVAPEMFDQTEMVGRWTRASLEREKTLVLRSIKELEFDHAMGKVSDTDWQEMAGRLRTLAARLIGQLDRRGGYRELIERELAVRLGIAGTHPSAAPASASAQVPAARPGSCPSCAAENDEDARFCKACGSRLESPAAIQSGL